MLSKFFIDRPIFAWVMAVIVMLAGIVAFKHVTPEASRLIHIERFAVDQYGKVSRMMHA